MTPKIKQIIEDNKDKGGPQVQKKAITFSGTTTIIGKRPSPVPNADHPRKRARAEKSKKGTKTNTPKGKTTPDKSKTKKSKKNNAGSTRQTAIHIGDDITSIKNEKTVKNVCNLSAKIDAINIGNKEKAEKEKH